MPHEDGHESPAPCFVLERGGKQTDAEVLLETRLARDWTRRRVRLGQAASRLLASRCLDDSCARKPISEFVTPLEVNRRCLQTDAGKAFIGILDAP